AAVALRAQFLRRQPTWSPRGQGTVGVGIGLNTGYATVRNIGSPSRMEYTVIGSAVNVGARLADLAGPGQILATKRSLATVGHLVEWRSIGERQLQGVPYPVEVVEILGVRLAARLSGDATEGAALEAVLTLAAE